MAEHEIEFTASAGLPANSFDLDGRGEEYIDAKPAGFRIARRRGFGVLALCAPANGPRWPR